MVTVVTSDDFEGLLNPYTGKPMKVMMNVTASGASFFSPDTYSTAERCESSEECYRKWNRANGIEGVKSGKPVTCAYTGKPLSLVHTDFGCYYTGGFDPHVFHTREEFLYYVTMRNGVAKLPKPSAPGRVKAALEKAVVTDNARKHADRQAPSLDDEKIGMIEKSMSGFKNQLGKSGTVSMSVQKRHGKR